VAGFSGKVPFDRAARQRIHQLSRGVPRRINLLCDRALLGSYAAGSSRVDTETVDKASLEVFGQADLDSAPANRLKRVAVLASVGGLLAGAALVGLVSWAAGWGTSRQAVAAAALPASAAASSADTAASQPPAAAASAVDLSAPIRLGLVSEVDAWRELASRWKVTLGDGDPCAAALREELQCFKSDDGLVLLKQLARPSVLTLYDNEGKPVYAVLVGLANQVASLSAGGATQTVSLRSLSKAWRGEFATLWRGPPGYEGKLTTGQSGAAVDWVAVQLAKLNGNAPPSGPQKFDAALQAKVAAFQVTQGLRADGKVGPLTLMQLNRAADVGEPRLQAETASN
jgi:general secretion pathway protein A